MKLPKDVSIVIGAKTFKNEIPDALVEQYGIKLEVEEAPAPAPKPAPKKPKK